MSKEQAKKELDNHINQHSKYREEANAQATEERLRREGYKRRERRENGRMWLDFHRSQWHAHVREASRHLDLHLQLKQQLNQLGEE